MKKSFILLIIVSIIALYESYQNNAVTADTNLTEGNLVITAVNNPLSINESKLKLINIYPNPTKGMVHIKARDSEEILSIKLYDLLGNVINISLDNNNTLNINDLSQRMYLLIVKTETNVYASRIIKK